MKIAAISSILVVDGMCLREPRSIEKQRHRKFQGGRVLVTIAALGISCTGTLAFADSVPESIRIQERAEKAYAATPVVPIERGNAHHRDFQKDEGDGGASGGYESVNPSQPPTAERHSTKK